MSHVAMAVLPPALLWAAVSDLLYRRIPNGLILLLLAGWAGGLAYAAVTGDMAGRDILHWVLRALPGAVLVLIVGFLLFRLDRVGAGDVKLTAVLCLWLGAADQAPFLIAMSLAGGLLALSLPALTLAEQALATLWLSLARRTSVEVGTPYVLASVPTRQGIPYAIAIAIGAALTLLMR